MLKAQQSTALQEGAAAAAAEKRELSDDKAQKEIWYRGPGEHNIAQCWIKLELPRFIHLHDVVMPFV